MSLSRIARLTALAGLVAALAGCATPIPQVFETTYQRDVRSAGHWEVLAREAVVQTASALGQAGVSADADLFVAQYDYASEFDQAFRQFLITELVQSGRSVRQSPEGAVKVDYSTIVIRHDGNEPRESELILTVAVSSGNRYLASKTDVYYIQGQNVGLFASGSPAPFAKVMEVVGQ